MKKIIQVLAQKLNLSEEEVLNKLELKETSSLGDISRALGVYSIFESKEEQTSYIKSKIQNKEKESQEILDKYKVLEQENLNLKESSEKSFETYEKQKENIRSIVKSKWEKLGIKRSFEKADIQIEALDFNNLTKSLLSIAEKEGFAIENKTEFKPKEETYTPNARTIADGVIIKN